MEKSKENLPQICDRSVRQWCVDKAIEIGGAQGKDSLLAKASEILNWVENK